MIKKYEDYGIVLDFLPQGHPDDPRPVHLREPIVQILGDTFFTLLEAVPVKDVTPVLHERVFIGKGRRDKIERVKRRIGYVELTAAAKAELPIAVEKLIDDAPERFIELFNKAAPLTTRFHQLELLPGIGKKLMWSIIEERKKHPFADFDDIEKRVRALPHPKKMVAKRIIMELEGVDKYRIFVRPPARRPEGEGEAPLR
ncbi:MAG: DUF655 domain-containing protein [Candidatus Hodarchaeaceae archaeon]|nr:DUF655 domain-containing protein [Candidatus Hodarchaeaceae archaeon]